MQTQKNVMVCVTQQRTCERLIMSGQKTLEDEADQLYVIHVVSEEDYFLNHSNDGEALEYLFRVSKKAGADLTVIRDNDVIEAIVNFAAEKSITNVVMGASPDIEDLDSHVIAMNLKKKLPKAEFVII